MESIQLTVMQQDLSNASIYLGARKGDLLDHFTLDHCLHYRTPGNDNIVHIAARFGHVAVVREALRAFPSLPFEKNSRGQTPLHLAAENGHLGVVKLLAGLSVMESDESGDAPLHKALRSRHQDAALHLLGLDENLAGFVNGDNESPLYLAAESRSDVVLETILRLSDDQYSVSGPLGQNALHAAVKNSRFAVKCLVERRPDLINKGDENNKTAVHYAAERHLKKILKPLLKTDPEAACSYDNDGFTPLHRAAIFGSYPAVKYILACCPQAIEYRDAEEGKTALHLAKMSRYYLTKCLKDTDMVNLVNERDHNGNTPLHLAVMDSDVKKAFVLLSTKDANWRLRNKNHQTPMDLCQPTDEEPSKEQHLMFVALKTHEEAWRSKGQRPKVANRIILQERFRKRRKGDLKQMIDNMALVATLIVTVTFTAAFTVPGGYNNTTGNVLLMQKAAIQVFYLSDIIAMLVSVSVIINYPLYSFFARPKRLSTIAYLMSCRLHVSLAFTVLAFLSGVYAVASNNALWIAILACTLGFLFVGFPIILSVSFSINDQVVWRRLKCIARLGH